MNFKTKGVVVEWKLTTKMSFDNSFIQGFHQVSIKVIIFKNNLKNANLSKFQLGGDNI